MTRTHLKLLILLQLIFMTVGIYALTNKDFTPGIIIIFLSILSLFLNITSLKSNKIGVNEKN